VSDRVVLGVRQNQEGEGSAERAPSTAVERAPAEETSPADLEPLTVPGFEGRPAIAVLPFDNLSGDPDQEYFADGIAEDLITRLSAWRSFPVIARNSSFAYKGKAVDVKQVSRELGVRYVVEGSARRASDRVRISAQLIDATTGDHVWSERYDRALSGIFALQSEMVEEILGAVGLEILAAEGQRLARKPSKSLTSVEAVRKGMYHLNRVTREDNEKARRLFTRAVGLDPGYPGAHALLGFTYSPRQLAGASGIRAPSRCRATSNSRGR
jgi:TolB-like protein